MKNSEEIEFKPYRIYRENQQYVEDFLRLTRLSYGITQQLLCKTPQEELPHLSTILEGINDKKESYSMADLILEDVKVTCGWLSYSEYAERTGISEEEVEDKANKGLLGKVEKHPETGLDVIIWPPEMQNKPPKELLQPGTYKVAGTYSHKFQTSIALDPENQENFEQTQNILLVLAHCIGNPETMSQNADKVLHKSCYLLQWTIFEVFLRSTLRELYRRHPKMLNYNSTGKKSTIGYTDILEITKEFTCLENLQTTLVEREIESKETNGQSVHGLINFLKSGFKFVNDPYCAWYMFEGNRKQASYNQLLEFKDVRNCLLHDGGIPKSDFYKKYPNVPIEDEMILVTGQYYHEAILALTSISYLIAQAIEEGEYSPKDS